MLKWLELSVKAFSMLAFILTNLMCKNKSQSKREKKVPTFYGFLKSKKKPEKDELDKSLCK